MRYVASEVSNAGGRGMVDKEPSLTEQVKRDILKTIKNGKYLEDAKIPTEKELCEIYRVSRITVQNAVLSLVRDGVLYRIKGKGTFVKKEKIQWRFMSHDTSFNDQIRAMGMAPSSLVLSLDICKATGNIADQMHIREGELVIRLLRLRYANGEPVAIVESHLPHVACSHIMERDFAIDSLHDALNEREESRIVRVMRYVEAIPASSTETMLLGVPKGSPIHFFTNYAFNADGMIVDFCNSYYRGDKSRFAVEIIPIE